MPADDQPKLGYICLYGSLRWEVRSDSSYHARELAIAHFRPPKSKRHLVSVHLAEIDGETVTHAPMM
jgi:hypothetical protein